MPRRKDPTNRDRALRRLGLKNFAAINAGWASWSAFETAVINNKVQIPRKVEGQ